MTQKEDKLKFSQMIERTAYEKKCSHIEAIVNNCEETGLEIEVVKTLINNSLKSKIESEAKALHYLPGGGSRLPI